MACVTEILYITFHVVPGGHAFDVDQGASDTGVGFEHGMGSQHDIVAEITVMLVGGIIIIFGNGNEVSELYLAVAWYNGNQGYIKAFILGDDRRISPACHFARGQGVKQRNG